VKEVKSKADNTLDFFKRKRITNKELKTIIKKKINSNFSSKKHNLKTKMNFTLKCLKVKGIKKEKLKWTLKILISMINNSDQFLRLKISISSNFKNPSYKKYFVF